MKFIKDGMEKDISNEKLQAMLLEDGWKTEELGNEIEEVKAELTELGIKFHPNTGLDKLKDKLPK